MDERPVTRYPIMDMSSPTGATEYTRYPQAGEANPIVRVGVVDVTGGGAGGAAPKRGGWTRARTRMFIWRA